MITSESLKKTGIFDKGYTPYWTEEIFTVSEVRYTDPITYKLKDLNGEEIKGSFYEQELRGRLKMQDRKMTDRKMTDKSAGLENAGLENDGQKCTVRI